MVSARLWAPHPPQGGEAPGKGRSTRRRGWAQGRTTTWLPGGRQTPAQHRCTATQAHRLLLTSGPGAAPGPDPQDLQWNW